MKSYLYILFLIIPLIIALIFIEIPSTCPPPKDCPECSSCNSCCNTEDVCADCLDCNNPDKEKVCNESLNSVKPKLYKLENDGSLTLKRCENVKNLGLDNLDINYEANCAVGESWDGKTPNIAPDYQILPKDKDGTLIPADMISSGCVVFYPDNAIDEIRCVQPTCAQLMEGSSDASICDRIDGCITKCDFIKP